MNKPWYKSKTMIFNILVTLAPIVGYLAASPDMLKSYMSPAGLAFYTSMVGILNVALRAVTTQGISFFQEDTSEKTPTA